MSTVKTSYPGVLLLAVALVGAGHASAQTRWTYSADGSEVTDNQSGLRWRRCSEGQTYSAGNCLGSASAFNHEQALARAKAQAGWRLPNIKELSSIVDTDRQQPSIDVLVFPATPLNSWYWSSSPTADNGGYAWFVNFVNGYVGVYDYRYGGFHVRLVRQQVFGQPVLSATPRIVRFGGSTTLSWNTNGAPTASCALTGPAIPAGLPDQGVGSFVVNNYSGGRSTYRLRCFDLETTVVVEQIPIGG